MKWCHISVIDSRQVLITREHDGEKDLHALTYKLYSKHGLSICLTLAAKDGKEVTDEQFARACAPENVRAIVESDHIRRFDDIGGEA